MLVAHVVSHLQPGSEAIQDHALALARQQRREGISAEVVILHRLINRASARKDTYDCIAGVPVHLIRCAGLAACFGVNLEPFDIVHVHTGADWRNSFVLTQVLHRKPLVISMHGNPDLAPLGAADAILRLAMRAYKRVFVHGQDQAASASAAFNNKLRPIRNTNPEPEDARGIIGEYANLLGSRYRRILGVTISTLHSQKAVAKIDHAITLGQPLKVCFANAHTLNMAKTNDQFRNSLDDFLVLNDGLGADIASRLKYGKPFAANLNGTDFIPQFLRATRSRLRIYLVGSTDAAVSQAAQRFRETFPRHTVVGWRNGFFTSPADIDETCRDIQTKRANCVLVGMGNPLQELWIQEHGPKTGAAVLIAVGALFDFEAEVVRRAPMWVRNLRCEWLYRLIQEPRRLMHRYLVGNFVFLGRVLADAQP